MKELAYIQLPNIYLQLHSPVYFLGYAREIEGQTHGFS